MKKKFLSKYTLILIPLIIISLPALVSYGDLNPPLVSKGARARLDVFFGSLPFLPKTNRQIILTAFYKNSKLQSAKQNLKLELKTEKDASLVSLNFSGSLDNEAEKYQASFEGNLGPKGFFPALKAESLQIDEEFYFKVDSLPPVGIDLSKLQGQWYKINLEKIAGEIRAATKSEQSIRADIEKFFEENIDQEYLLDLFKGAEMGEEGEEIFLVLGLDRVDLEKLLKRGFDIQEANLTLVVSRRTRHLISLQLEAQVGSDFLTSLGTNRLALGEKQKLFLKWELSQIGETIDPTLPDEKEVKSLSSSFDLMQAIEGKTVSENPLELLFSSRKASEYSVNLLTAASLERVLLLIPTADLISF